MVEYNWQYTGPEDELGRDARQAWFEVHWEERRLDVVGLTWQAHSYGEQSHFWISSKEPGIAEKFFKVVNDHYFEVRDEILVFNGGCFTKDKELFEAIRMSRLENLVLAGDAKDKLADDCRQFFNSEALYEKHKVPWKRGYLLMGPPGNGKSHAVKALINELQRPALYVQSFKSEHTTDHEVMRTLFNRARVTTPCILVVEDLDSLINDGNRSFFLNELDGFASNHGILAIATTNHPERLDPAILDRPSRFDRKYVFELPGPTERAQYLGMWNAKLEEELKLSPEGLAQVARDSENFSYAYLKELVLSSMMAWMSRKSGQTVDQIMLEVLAPLSQQTSTVEETPEPGAAPFDPREYLKRRGLFR